MCIDQCNGSYPRGQQGGLELLNGNTQREMEIQLFFVLLFKRQHTIVMMQWQLLPGPPTTTFS